MRNLQIDWQHLQDLADGDSEFELELLQMFVEDTLSHLDLIKAAIAAHDIQQLKREAHHLKGTSANVGAVTMRLAAEKLEQLPGNQEWRGSAELVSELEESVKHIQASLIDRQRR